MGNYYGAKAKQLEQSLRKKLQQVRVVCGLRRPLFRLCCCLPVHTLTTYSLD